MIDITHKVNTLRMARAQATVKVGDPETVERIRSNQIPKGNVLEMARTAGLLGLKRTAELIPDCHPLPVESAAFQFDTSESEISILLEVKTIYKTGVEVEAMHGASVAALTIYDMLKPIDKQVEITSIKLLEKKGGKSDFKDKFRDALSALVVVCSDTISAGQKTDKAGKGIVESLNNLGVDDVRYQVIPDEADSIRSEVETAVEQGIRLVIFTGGTGLSSRDVTPETITPMLDRRIPGMEEAIRAYGQQRTPYSMLSRSVAGTIGSSLILALPGSTKGALESMDAIFPHALHVFGIMKGKGH